MTLFNMEINSATDYRKECAFKDFKLICLYSFSVLNKSNCFRAIHIRYLKTLYTLNYLIFSSISLVANVSLDLFIKFCESVYVTNRNKHDLRKIVRMVGLECMPHLRFLCYDSIVYLINV